MPTTTYEISFYKKNGELDSHHQMSDADSAWYTFRCFAEEESADAYSRITLAVYDWNGMSETTLATLTF